MLWYYKYNNENWARLPVVYDDHGIPVSMINQPAKTSVKINRSSYEILRQGFGAVAKTLESFEDMVDGDNISGRTNWTITLAGTGTAKAHSLHDVIVAEFIGDDTNQSDGIYTFPNATPQTPSSTYQYWISFDIEIDAGQVVIRLSQSASDRINIKFQSGILYYYNGTTYVDSGITYSNDILYTVKIRVLTTTTFELSLIDKEAPRHIHVATGLSISPAWNAVMTKLSIITDFEPLTASTIYIDNIQASWDTESVTWDESNTVIPFMKICATPDSVSATNLETLFDSQIKFDLYKMSRLVHDDNQVVFEMEQYHAQLFREEHSENDNVATTATITSLTTTNVIDCGTPGWTPDAYINYGCRITKRTPLKTFISVTTLASEDYNPTYTGDSVSTGGAAGNMDDDDDNSYWKMVDLNAHDDTSEIYFVFDFPVSRCPDGNYELTIRARFSNGYTTDSTSATPKLYIYNYNTATYVLLRTLTRADIDYVTKITISATINDPDLECYNFTDQKIRIMLTSGNYSRVGGTVTGQRLEIYFAQLGYNLGYQHDPVEFKITDNDADELTLNCDIGSNDLNTNHVGEGDSIQLVYDDKTWFENHVINRALDINAISAPTLDINYATPTYSVKKHELVRLDIETAEEKNAWYSYITRTTTNGLPNLVFRERASPPNYGLSIFPANIILPKLPSYDINFLDKISRFTVINDDNDDGTSGSGDPSDFPPLIVKRGDIPSAYLNDIAIMMHGERTILDPSFPVTIRTIRRIDEDFGGLSGKITTASTEWAASTTTDGYDGSTAYYHVETVSGDEQLHLYDSSVTKSIYIWKQLKIARLDTLSNGLNTVTFTIKGTTALSASAYINIRLDKSADANTKIDLLITLNDGKIYSADTTPIYQDTGKTITLGTETIVEIFLINTTTHKIRVNSGAYSASMNNRATLDTSGIGYIAFITPSKQGYEDFSTYGEGGDIIALSADWDWALGGTGATFLQSSNVGKFVTTTTRSVARYTFPTARLFTANDWVSFKLTPHAGGVNILMRNSDNNTFVRMQFQSDNDVRVQNDASYVDLGFDWVDDTEYAVKFLFISTTQFDVVVNGTTYDNSGSHFTYSGAINMSGKSTTRIRFDSDGYDPIEVDIDDLITSWPCPGPGPDTIEAYIDDICDDGNIGVQSIEPAYFHAGVGIDIHFGQSSRSSSSCTVNKYNKVIKSLKFLNNGNAELIIGFEPGSKRTIEELKELALLRSRFNQ